MYSAFLSKHKQLIIQMKVMRLFSQDYLEKNHIRLIPTHEP